MAVNFNLVTPIATPVQAGDYRFNWGSLAISLYAIDDSNCGNHEITNAAFGILTPSISDDYVPIPIIGHRANFNPSNFNLIANVTAPDFAGEVRFRWGNLALSTYGINDSAIGSFTVENAALGVFAPSINQGDIPVPIVTVKLKYNPLDFNLVDDLVPPTIPGDIRFQWTDQSTIGIVGLNDGGIGAPFIYGAALAINAPSINIDDNYSPILFNYQVNLNNPEFPSNPLNFHFIQSSSPDASALNFDFTGLLGIAFGSIYNGEIGSVTVYNSDQYITVGGDDQSEINEPELILLLNKTFPPSIDDSEFGTLTIYKSSKEIFAPSISQSAISSGNVIYFSNTDLLTQNFMMMLF